MLTEDIMQGSKSLTEFLCVYVCVCVCVVPGFELGVSYFLSMCKKELKFLIYSMFNGYFNIHLMYCLFYKSFVLCTFVFMCACVYLYIDLFIHLGKVLEINNKRFLVSLPVPIVSLSVSFERKT
jgi:hypothetical protein